MGIIDRITHQCAVLNYGRRIGEGTLAEIGRHPGVQEAYLGVA
jgi:ABC-type branched-subunit amino acid transport system ATPase component